MSITKLGTIDKTVQETNELLKDIESEFGWEGQKGIAYDALRAVLLTLRDRLTVDEASNLSSQLPILIRGLFFEGFQPSKMPIKMNEEEFFEEVRKKFPLSTEFSTKDLIQGVLLALSHYISEGEMKNIIDTLPKKLTNTLSIQFYK